MHLAYVMTEERGATDRLLSELAERLQAKGLRLAGIVQTNVECYDKELCDMDVRVLPDGETIRISQSLGAGARGCRLNPEALEQAVGQVSASLQSEPAPQLLIVNKFGKHEADGRGMIIPAAFGPTPIWRRRRDCRSHALRSCSRRKWAKPRWATCAAGA